MQRIELKQLELLNMRNELLAYMYGLTDKEYQYQAWVMNDVPEGYFDHLDYTIHFLYDDTSLASDPASDIGYILTDLKEVDAVRNVTNAIDVVFDKYGMELSDAEYIATPEWDDVIAQAKIAMRVLLSAN